MSQIDKLNLPQAKPGAVYRTDSGASFKVVDGTVVVISTFGCLGCDMSWAKVEIQGKPGHEINADSVMYCTRLYDTPVAVEKVGKGN